MVRKLAPGPLGLGAEPTVRKHAGALAVIIAVPNMGTIHLFLTET